MAISNLVREARRRADLSQAELARRAGVPKSTVGRIESAARVPSTEMVERLVRAAGLAVSVSLSDPDPGTNSMFERTLRRSPAERLADATRVAVLSCAGVGKSRPQRMASTDFDPERMFSALVDAEVRFILIGGMAAVLHGDVGVTVDIDVVPEPTDENLQRLAAALRGLGARLRSEGEPGALAFDCSAEFFRKLPPASIVYMTTEAGALDVTFCPSGTSGYTDLKRDAIDVEAADRLHILLASLADVIRSKEAAGRETDRLGLPRLRRLLDRLQGDG